MSFTLGKPSGIEDINIDIPLPTLVSFGLSTRGFFIAWIKLSRILGEIWKFGYSSKPKTLFSNWTVHAMDQKSKLRQIRSALASWLKELPDEFQYQYLPNSDPRSLIQLTRFSAFAGYINILFHTCIILLHQPYLTQAYDDPKIEMLKTGQSGPIKTCLTAAITITDIARTTRKFDPNAFRNFQYPIYGVLQSSVLEMVIMNASKENESLAKKSLNDAVEELRFIADNSSFMSMREVVKEFEGVMMIANSKTSDIVIPFPLVLQILEYNNNKAGGNFAFPNMNSNQSNRNLDSNNGHNNINNHNNNNNKLSTLSPTSPLSENSTISIDSTNVSDEKMKDSLKVEYPTSINRVTNTTTNLSTESHNSPNNNISNMSNLYMMTPPNLFNPQDQASLQFHQIQSSLDPDPWDHSLFMNDSIYEFMDTHHVSESDSNDSNEFQSVFQ